MNRFSRIVIYFQLLWAMPMVAQDVRVVSQVDDANFGCLTIGDLNESEIKKINSTGDLKEIFQVYPQEVWPLKNNGIPPVLGTYIFEKEEFVFRPRFPFQEGKSYVLVAKAGKEKIFFVDIPKWSEKKSTELIAVYPTGLRVPSNLLKIYLEFSGPMSLANPYSYIRLHGENGEEVPAPFLEIEPPLWDAEQKRLTLWFDPGRIKSGLSPNVKWGPPLEPGKNYTLQISEEWKDAFGQPIVVTQEKKWFTIAPDFEQPKPESWRISKPMVGTQEPLVIHFSEALDFGVIKNGLGVKDGKGSILKGEIIVSDMEMVWQFFPSVSWEEGRYSILVSKSVEDLAGNNLERPFDKNLLKEKNKEPVLELEFSLSPQK